MLVYQNYAFPSGAGLSDLSMDGSGIAGTGLFGDNWGWPEVVVGLVGLYAIYSMFYQAKQTKYRAEMAAGRRRKKRAASYRAKAKKLEEQSTGFGGLFF